MEGRPGELLVMLVSTDAHSCFEYDNVVTANDSFAKDDTGKMKVAVTQSRCD